MLTVFQDKIALGSKTELTLVCEASRERAEVILRNFWATIFTFEKKFSRFLPQSELSQFNKAAGVRQPISPEFAALLKAAINAAAQSGGLYNPFILPALQRAGYIHSFVSAHRQDAVDNYSERRVVPIDHLDIGPTWARIPEGTALDMGGCGKGFLCDRLAELAASLDEVRGYYVSLGGDVVVGGCTEDGKQWTVGIEHSVDQSASLAGIVAPSYNKAYAVATSSVLYRKGNKNGTDWHHIIDPRTGQPAQSAFVTASIAASSGLIADVAASCVLMLDEHEALQLVDAMGACGLLLQRADGSMIRWGDIVCAD